MESMSIREIFGFELVVRLETRCRAPASTATGESLQKTGTKAEP